MYRLLVSLPSYLTKRKSSSSRIQWSSTKPEMKILNVAEKNDSAKHIANFLSNGNLRKREGCSTYNKIFEFDCEVFSRNNRMVMTSVSGHLLELQFDSKFHKWNSCNPVVLFDAPTKLICSEKYEAIKRNLENEMRSCNMLIIWTDCDREGESIGFEIVQVCKVVKPNVEVYRAKFSEITKDSVTRALKSLERLNKCLNEAVQVRTELDLRIGAAFTRLQTLYLGKAFPTAFKDTVISYGSCQFPTLGFVIDRFKSVLEFVSEPFWEINVKHTVNDLTVDFVWKRNKLFDKLACEVLFDKCKESGIATVVDVKSNPKTNYRPKPLDTVELQKQGSRKLGLTAKETLGIAEKLYSTGLISYPRTETTIFPKEINLEVLVQEQVNDPHWGEFAQKVLNDGPNPFQGNKSDQAHPPIHPLKYTKSLKGNENRVYEFIVRHFLACLSKHAEGLETTIEIDIASERFVGKGLMIIAKNYLEVYPYKTWNDKEINIYKESETFHPKIEMKEGKTSPPNLLTEADLITLMDKHGIGTDATQATHIETIKSRFYVGLKDNKFFVPRTLGMGLVEGYSKMGYQLDKPEMRAELEADLKGICENKKSPKEVLARHVKNYKEIYAGVSKQINRLINALQTYLQMEAHPVEFDSLTDKTVMHCPNCGNAMTLKKKEKYISCQNFRKCRTIFRFPSIISDVTVLNETCSKCGPNVSLLSFKFEKNYSHLPSKGCVGGCDPNLLNLLNFSSLRPVKTKVSQGSKVDSSLDDTGFESLGESLSSGNINCYCGVPAISLTVKNEGPNKGRIFYKCGRTEGSFTCKFFQWDSSQTDRSQRTLRENSQNQTEEDIRCYCAIPCRRGIGVKDGPNKGRPFYVCGKHYKDVEKCNFFKWADNNENCRSNAFSFTRSGASRKHFASGYKKNGFKR